MQETVQVIARVGFKMFLNINANVTGMNAEGTECRWQRLQRLVLVRRVTACGVVTCDRVQHRAG